MPVGARITSQAMMLINRPIQGLLPNINRSSINTDNDDARNKALEANENKFKKDSDTPKTLMFFSAGSTTVVQQKDGSCGYMES